MITKRQILADGTQTSSIGLGCMSFTGIYGASDLATSLETLDAARAHGLSFLDTANIYGAGMSEEIIGTYIARYGNPFFIATKAGIARHSGDGSKPFDNSQAHLRAELEGSLRRLGVEVIDLFYVHRREAEREIEEVMHTLLEFKAEGKIRGIGFSEISPTSLRRAAAIGPVDAVQSEYSLWTRSPELGLIQTCAALGVAFVPFSPLGRGMFSDHPPNPKTFRDKDIRVNIPRFQAPHFAQNHAICDRLRNLAQDYGIATATLALAWCLAQERHILPIPGTRTRAHLRECIDAAAYTICDELNDALRELMPIGWALGDRYGPMHWQGVELYS